MNVKKYFNQTSIVDNYLILSLCMIPIGLIAGTFVAELFFNLSIILGSFLIFKKKDYNFNLNLIIYFFSLYLFVISVNIINYSNGSKIYFTNIVAYLRFFLFVIIITKALLIINLEKIQIILRFLSLTIFFIACDILIQKIFGKNILGFVAYENRYSSFFRDEYISGSFVAKFFLICAVSLSFIYNKKYQNKIFIFLIILLASSVLFSGDRNALITFTFTLSIFCVFYKKFRKSIIIFFIIFSCSIGTTYKVKPELLGRWTFIIDNFLDQNQTPKQKNYKKIITPFKNVLIEQGYYQLFSSSLKIWNNNKFIGTGWKTYRHECSKAEYKLKDNKNYCSTHPHNYYFEILSEHGIFGLFFFLFGFIYVIYKHIIISFKCNIKDESMYFAFFSTFISYYLIISSGRFTSNWNSIIFWFIFTFLIFFQTKMLSHNKK